ncbi:hypothetical protein OS493_001740 [Desmophyllum pertusum]|uniref:Uncharacterized protein n=1 Tax=Desmophyllum pertusum TaxID=174260 RepID=A0A9X0CT16_9CNID|nr:hypothetical protein OS493_001740 [Desmophyllum pertusum]
MNTWVIIRWRITVKTNAIPTNHDNVFGFENNYHYLTPDIYEVEPRNQVRSAEVQATVATMETTIIDNGKSVCGRPPIALVGQYRCPKSKSTPGKEKKSTKTEAGIQEIESTEELNGTLPSGPIGLETVI